MNDYIAAAMRTAAPLDSNAADFAHAALGLVDEAHELDHATDNENLLEELGDLLWFSALACTATNHYEAFKAPADPLDDLPEGGACENARRIATEAAVIAGIAKKWWVYGKTPDLAEVQPALTEIVRSVEAIALAHDWPLSVVKAANIQKLRARFPRAYDAQRAIHRNHDAEREALGG